MGTRGAVGFRVGSVDKVMYNHFDSYPSELGSTVASFVAGRTDEQLAELAVKIELIDGNVPPTDAQKQMCRDAGSIDLSVSEGTEDDWYCLLRNHQGSLEGLEALPLMTDNSDFLADSLFCEYGYLINVDTGRLEVYRGFNERDDREGRYAQLRTPGHGEEEFSEYYGVALVAEIPFSVVRELGESEIVDKMESLCNGVRGQDSEGEEVEGLEDSFEPWRPTSESVAAEDKARKEVQAQAAEAQAAEELVDALVDGEG